MYTVAEVKEGITKKESVVEAESLGYPVVQDLHTRWGKILTGVVLTTRKKVPVEYNFSRRAWISKNGKVYVGHIINY